MNFGALAGGVAQGFNATRQMMNQSKYADAYEKAAAIDEEKHGWAKEARDKVEADADTWKKGIIGAAASGTAGGAPLIPISTPAAGFNNQLGNTSGLIAPQNTFMYAGQGVPTGPGYAQGGLVQIPNQVFSGQAPGAYQAGGLASPPQQAPQAQQPPQQPPEKENLTINQQLTKALLTTDLLTNPDKLNQALAIAEAHGAGNIVKPWLERAYAAKKSGMLDGAQELMRGQVDDAMTSLARGGMKLEDRPVKVNDDPNDHHWKFNIAGTGEKVVNVANMLETTLDADKFVAAQQKKAELADKARETDADIDLKKSQAEYYRGARSEQARAAAARYGRLGDGSARADRPEKIDAALKRRDAAIDDLSSVQGDDGKFNVDPMKRQIYSSLAVDAEDAITQHLGRDLTAKEHHRLTDRLRTAPLGNAQGMEEWGMQLERAFGGGGNRGGGEVEQQQPQPQIETPVAAPAATPAPAPAAAPLGERETAPAAPARQGGLAGLREQQQLKEEMNGVQAALKSPNLSDKQRLALALQAQEISKKTDAYFKGR